jgi:hypothetical protein
MDSLQDILASRTPQEPPEIWLIRQYVRETFGETVHVGVSRSAITIHVPSASLAGALRLRTPQLKELCQTDKRLVFRINA